MPASPALGSFGNVEHLVGGIGIAAYVYRELLARFIVPVYDYTVADVPRPTRSLAEALG